MAEQNTETIIVHPPEGVHVGSHETIKVVHNGDEYILPYKTPVVVPQCVLDVLTDSHKVWSHVERADPTPEAEPKVKGKAKEKEDEQEVRFFGKKKDDGEKEEGKG